MASAHVRADADRAFAYLSDPRKLGRWSLGCFDTRPYDDQGVFHGTSLFDNGEGWFKVRADHGRGVIDYGVGTPDRLSYRICARVVDAGAFGYENNTSLVMLTAWRPKDMSDERWARLCAAHEAEIWLIKSQIETEAPQP
jgi:hypothetical protein